MLILCWSHSESSLNVCKVQCQVTVWWCLERQNLFRGTARGCTPLHTPKGTRSPGIFRGRRGSR